MSLEAMKQLREVHAIQGRDGCWNIDDYMLGLYNGLELALSIMENRKCVYKYLPKEEKQEPVAWFGFNEQGECREVFTQKMRKMFPSYPTQGMTPVYTSPPQRQPLSDEQIEAIANEYGVGGWICDFARAIEAAHGITGEKNG